MAFIHDFTKYKPDKYPKAAHRKILSGTAMRAVLDRHLVREEEIVLRRHEKVMLGHAHRSNLHPELNGIDRVLNLVPGSGNELAMKPDARGVTTINAESVNGCDKKNKKKKDRYGMQRH